MALVLFGLPLFLCIFSSSVISMQPPTNTANSGDNYNSHWIKQIEQFDNLEESSKKKWIDELQIRNNRFLFAINARHFDNKVFKLIDPNIFSKQKITQEENSIISHPSSIQSLALNLDGTSVAISSINLLAVIPIKGKTRENQISEVSRRHPIKQMAFKTNEELVYVQPATVYVRKSKTENFYNCAVVSNQKPLISQTGLWVAWKRFFKDKLHLTLTNLETGMNFPLRDSSVIPSSHYKYFLVDNENKYFILASSLGCRVIKIKFDSEQFFIKKAYNLDQNSCIHITDIDLNSSNQTLALNDNHERIRLYNYKTQKCIREFLTQSFLFATKFNPRDNSLLFTDAQGIHMIDPTQSEDIILSFTSVPIKKLAISADGLTLAATTDDRIYITSIRELQKSFSFKEHILLYLLMTSKNPDTTLAHETFSNIFENIKSGHVKEIINQLIDQRRCTICADHLIEQRLSCGHAFCGICIKTWKDMKKTTCPICRASF